MHYKLMSLFLLFFINPVLPAQETARAFFNQVIQKYDTINSLQANVYINVNSDAMQGRLLYKSPNLMQIKFSNPSRQVINIKPDKIEIYIPEYEANFIQKIDKNSPLVLSPTRDSLDVLASLYGISYISSPEWTTVENIPVPVRLLRFSRRSEDAGFKSMTYTIGNDLLIYKIDARDIYNSQYSLLFSNINTVDDILAQEILDYKLPSSSNDINDFYSNTEEQ